MKAGALARRSPSAQLMPRDRLGWFVQKAQGMRGAASARHNDLAQLPQPLSRGQQTTS